MRRIVFALLFCAPLFAAQVFRVDPTPAMTTAGNAPAGGYPALHAVGGATVQLCTDAACGTPATAYKDATGNVACPLYAPVTLPGSNLCTSTAGSQGQFGFWLEAGTYYYKLTLPNGTVYSGLPVSAGGGSSAAPAATLPFLVSADYDFAPIAPGGNLVAGANVIIFPTVPRGVNGTNLDHRLLVSGGNGTPEACLIIGGAGQAGEHNGQILIQCAGPHSGGWTIKSATSGVQEAVKVLEAGSGGEVLAPAGTHTMYAPVSFSGLKPVVLRGSGAHATIFDGSNMPASFSGMFIGSGISSKYNPEFRDFTVQYSQPDSSDRTTYTQWTAFYLAGTDQVHISNVNILEAWNGITATGNAGGLVLDNLGFGTFNQAITIDGAYDVVQMTGIRVWPFWFAASANKMAAFSNVANVGLDVGYCDGCRVSDSMFLNPIAINQHVGSGGSSKFLNVSNTLFDTDAEVLVSEGSVQIANCAFSSRGKYPWIRQTGGTLQLANNKFYLYDTPTATSMLQLAVSSGATNGFLQASGNQFLTVGYDLPSVRVDSSGTGFPNVSLTGNFFIRTPGLPYTAPTIQLVQTAGNITSTIEGNHTYPLLSGSGTFLSVSADNSHRIKANNFNGWASSYPINRVYGEYEDSAAASVTGFRAATVGTALTISGSTITPTRSIHTIGAGTVTTITAPAIGSLGTTLTVIPTAATQFDIGANIGKAVTAVIGQALTFTYDGALWWPSY